MKTYSTPDFQTTVFFTKDIITVSPGGGIVLPFDPFDNAKKKENSVDIDELFG